jgi:hypothetical protein
MKRLTALAVLLAALWLVGGVAAEEEGGPELAAERRHELANHMEEEAHVLMRTAELGEAEGEVSRAEAMEMKRRALELRHEAVKLREEPPEKPPDPFGMPSGMPLPPRPAGASSFGRPISVVAPAGSSVLIVPAEPMDEKRREALTEDLTVMTRVLRKALGPHTHAAGGGYYGEEHGVLAPLFDGRRPESIYLEGFGALFVLDVPFALTEPEPRKPELREQPEEDSLWEQARREVTGHGALHPGMGMETPGGMGKLRLPGYGGGFSEEQPRPDRKTVDRLIEVLLQALRHASNIRGLGPDESLAVVLLGPPPPRAIKLTKGPYGAAYAEDLLELGKGRATTLTVRVKKAHVDALAEGEMSEEEFREHATVLLQ